MAITAKLLRAEVNFRDGFSNTNTVIRGEGGMDIRVRCQLRDDAVGDLGIRDYSVANNEIHQQIVQILQSALPMLQPVIGVPGSIPANTTLVGIRV